MDSKGGCCKYFHQGILYLPLLLELLAIIDILLDINVAKESEICVSFGMNGMKDLNQIKDRQQTITVDVT